MNEHISSHLGRLLDEATAHYNPQPDVARFERMLLVQHRRRTGVIVWSAAACLALIGGTAFAFNQQQPSDDHRLAPAHSGTESSGSTEVKTKETWPPDKTSPDGGRDPIDKTTVPTVPKTEPPTTEKKEPPKTTQPKTTEPKEEETTTTEPGSDPWSVHQVYFTSDSEPPLEVFWGTANIGDKIKIWSDYGSVRVFADEYGNWEAHIYFEGAPVGVPFDIYVQAPYHEDVFSFTYLG